MYKEMAVQGRICWVDARRRKLRARIASASASPATSPALRLGTEAHGEWQ